MVVLAGSRQQSEDEDEEEGEGSGEEEEDWRKTIMIGSAYQAQVPEGLQRYGATPPYENEDKLLWEPGKLMPKQVKYLVCSYCYVLWAIQKGVEYIFLFGGADCGTLDNVFINCVELFMRQVIYIT